MHSMLLDSAVACGTTALAIRLLDSVAHQCDWLDYPRGRKDHAVATPLTGGAAVALGIFTTLLIDPSQRQLFAGFTLGALLLLVVGVADDFLDLSWVPRLLTQIGAATILVFADAMFAPGASGLVVASVVPPGLGAIVSIVVIVGVINAINMADGCDGVVAATTVISLAMVGGECALGGDQELLALVSIFGGAVTGFLTMNMRFPWQPRALAFLGDSGAAIIGLAMGWIGLRFSRSPSIQGGIVLAPWFMAPVLIDCVVSIALRLRRRRSPFRADRRHLHHWLIDAGFSSAQVAVIIAGLTLLFGLAALAALQLGAPRWLLVAAFVFLTAADLVFMANRRRTLRALRRLRLKLRRQSGRTFLQQPNRR